MRVLALILAPLTVLLATKVWAWYQIACEWRSLYESTRDERNELYEFQSHLLQTVHRAYAIAEAFGPGEAFDFILAELDPESSPIDPMG